jgi:hypothetical protein
MTRLDSSSRACSILSLDLLSASFDEKDEVNCWRDDESCPSSKDRAGCDLGDLRSDDDECKEEEGVADDNDISPVVPVEAVVE